ncbi:MAG: glycosyltransferase family 4 protein, partial [Pseudomonadota bacterium]
EWLATCTRGGAEYLDSLVKNKVNLVYHGLDLERFPENPQSASNNDGSSASQPVKLVTVGRAVAKKGLDTLLHALAKLPADLHWQWTHIGGGPLRNELIDLTERLGLSQRCSFLGALPQAEVLQTYRKSDLFILPSRIDESGDRDGLPNVIVEAQSQSVAVLSTNISGIPELVDDSVNGVLIEPDDVEALASAIGLLARDPRLRNSMGANGNRIVRERFDHTKTIGRLVELLDGSIKDAKK